jgi:hypothetical protein
MPIITLIQIFDDVYIDSSQPDTNFSNSTVLWVGKQENEALQRSLLKFDLSFIPAGSKIITANLNVYLDYDASEMEIQETITPFAITDSWDVSTVTWNNQPAISTSIRGFVTNLSTPGYYCFIITDFVERWVNQGFANNGLELKSNEINIDDNKRFVSSDEALVDKQSFKPVFVVQYEPLQTEQYDTDTKPLQTEQYDTDFKPLQTEQYDTDSKPPVSVKAIITGKSTDAVHEEVTTTDEYQTTMIRDTSDKTHVSFFVNNLSENLADVGIEVSSDGVNFLRQSYDPIPQGLEIFIPYYYAPYTRLYYKSKLEGEHTKLSIDFVSQT